MKKIKEEYYVRCVNEEQLLWWKSRYYKKIYAPVWEKLDPKRDNINEIIKTHIYSFDTYPDNDDFHIVVNYDVEIKRIEKIEEII